MINHHHKHSDERNINQFYFFSHSRPETTSADSQNDYFSSYTSTDESLINQSDMRRNRWNGNEIEAACGEIDSSNQPFSHHHDSLHPHQQLATADSLSSSSNSLCRSSSVDTDLETLDRELNALDAAMPLVDPEITQGAEQLEKAISRKRSRSEEDNDRLVREALSQFYLPSPRLLSGIDDCPLLLSPEVKRSKASSPTNGLVGGNDLLDFDIIDALRLGSSPNASTVGNSASDSCGQAAMMSENGVFHNLVVASLET